MFSDEGPPIGDLGFASMHSTGALRSWLLRWN
jgi:hypothetical protein